MEYIELECPRKGLRIGINEEERVLKVNGVIERNKCLIFSSYLRSVGKGKMFLTFLSTAY